MSGEIDCAKFLISLVTLSHYSGAVNSLMCYTCENKETNFMCVSDFDLKNCNHEKYDTCQTVVAYSAVSEKVTITKSCTTNASCHLQQTGTPNTPCVLTNPVWVCTFCCHDDACNFNSAVTVSAGYRTLPFVSFVSVVFQAFQFSHLINGLDVD